MKKQLNEIDIEDIEDLKLASGSTHVMTTGYVSGDPCFIKFSDQDLFDVGDPSLQILVEYLAYRIYKLYPLIKTPGYVDLVFDKKKSRVGLATGAVKGKAAVPNISAEQLGKLVSAGVYVDIFLANWDVIGTGSGNVIIDDDYKEITRIDPGGSLTFRAQGGKKGGNFSDKTTELQSMLDPSRGSGRYFKYSDLHSAADTFLEVSWEQIDDAIFDTNVYITSELEKYGLTDLLNEWENEYKTIFNVLKKRWAVIKQNAELMK